MPVFQKNNKKVLFIHIPKAGGTSIEHLFIQNGWKMNFFDGGGEFSVNSYSHCSPQHMHMELLRTLFRFQAFDCIFSFVRNPIDRIKSEYKWRCKYLNETRLYSDWILDSLRMAKENKYAFDNHLRPQHEFIDSNVNVFRLEDGVFNGMQKLLNNFSLDLDITNIPNSMVSNDMNKFVDMPDDVVSEFLDFYSCDFERFDYEKV